MRKIIQSEESDSQLIPDLNTIFYIYYEIVKFSLYATSRLSGSKHILHKFIIFANNNILYSNISICKCSEYQSSHRTMLQRANIFFPASARLRQADMLCGSPASDTGTYTCVRPPSRRRIHPLL